MKFEIPELFRTDTIAREGDAGHEWLKGLPVRIRDLCDRWNLTIDGAPMHGYLAIVLPVLQNDNRCALKVSWIDRYSEHETLALTTWDGNGAVKLIESDDSEGAMLLERLDSGRTLETLKREKAIRIAGSLLRRLSVAAPEGVPSIAFEADVIREELPVDWQHTGEPFSRETLDKASRLLAELRQQSDQLLVNHDLHYGNVLAGTREPWLVIDPKVFAGDPEFAVVQLLWQEFAAIGSKSDLDRMFAILIEAAELDFEKARKWAYVRLVSNWLWSLKAGFSNDASRSQQLVEWL